MYAQSNTYGFMHNVHIHAPHTHICTTCITKHMWIYAHITCITRYVCKFMHNVHIHAPHTPSNTYMDLCTMYTYMHHIHTHHMHHQTHV